MRDTPDHLRALDRKLSSVGFMPRASFGPELLGRLRRRDQPRGAPAKTPRRRYLLAAALALLAAGAGLARLGSPLWGDAVTVDRCCYDLDGGGAADDGVLVLAQRDDRVHRLRIYEDLDRSSSYTAGDLVRLDRGGTPSIGPGDGDGFITIKRCCVDFDGGGPDDDGLLVIGVPPDRVLMAAIYETGAKARSSTNWLLR